MTAPQHVPRGDCPSAPAALPVEPSREVGEHQANPSPREVARDRSGGRVRRATPSLVHYLLGIALIVLFGTVSGAALGYSYGYKHAHEATYPLGVDDGNRAGWEAGYEQCLVDNGLVC